jgi:hypothetical protein
MLLMLAFAFFAFGMPVLVGRGGALASLGLGPSRSDWPREPSGRIHHPATGDRSGQEGEGERQRRTET